MSSSISPCVVVSGMVAGYSALYLAKRAMWQLQCVSERRKVQEEVRATASENETQDMYFQSSRFLQELFDTVVFRQGSSDECNAQNVKSLPNTHTTAKSALVSEVHAKHPHWQDSTLVKSCYVCRIPFTLLRRKHHCRSCGKVICNGCSKSRMRSAKLDGKAVRVCDACTKEASCLAGESGTQLSNQATTPN